MYIDQATADAFFNGPVEWIASDWQCRGVDPTIFPKGEVPFKKFSEDHSIAAKYYAMAFRKGGVTGAPVILLQGSLPRDLSLLQHFEHGSIRVYGHIDTVAFTQVLHSDTFHGLHWNVYPLDGAAGQDVLTRGAALLG